MRSVLEIALDSANVRVVYFGNERACNRESPRMGFWEGLVGRHLKKKKNNGYKSQLPCAFVHK